MSQMPLSSFFDPRNHISRHQASAHSLAFGYIPCVAQSKDGISSLHLARTAGISANAALRMKHKLQQVMKDQDDQQPLTSPLKKRPSKSRDFWQNTILTEEVFCHEDDEIYRGTDSVCAQAV